MNPSRIGDHSWTSTSDGVKTRHMLQTSNQEHTWQKVWPRSCDRGSIDWITMLWLTIILDTDCISGTHPIMVIMAIMVIMGLDWGFHSNVCIIKSLAEENLWVTFSLTHHAVDHQGFQFRLLQAEDLQPSEKRSVWKCNKAIDYVHSSINPPHTPTHTHTSVDT